MVLLGIAGCGRLAELVEFIEVALGSELGDVRRIHNPAIVLDDGAAKRMKERDRPGTAYGRRVRMSNRSETEDGWRSGCRRCRAFETQA